MTRDLMRTATLLAVCLAAALWLAGCAAQRGAPETWWGDPETGIVMEYRMPEGKPLTYQVTNDQTQYMEVMGQTTDVVIEQKLMFDIVPGKMSEKEQDLEITVNSFAMSMVMPQGEVSPPTEALSGQTFKMGVDRKGKELNCEKAEGLSYTVPESGEQNLSSQFCEFFPDLPEEPVKVGDSWESTITLDEGDASTDVTLEIRSTNTLAGFEQAQGHDCARVETEFTGTVTGEGTQGPATFVMTGTVEGSGTWHFAYKEGILVSDFSIGVSEGDIAVKGPQEMTIPTSREFVMESRLMGPEDEPKIKAAALKKPVEKKMSDMKPITKADVPPHKKQAEPEPEPYVVTAGGFTAAGARGRFETMAEATPEAFESLWMNEFMPHDAALSAASTDKRYYGVSYGTGEGESFYYLAGMAVAEDAQLPEGVFEVEVPEREFAVFETDLEGISRTWTRAFQVWLPKSGYEYDWSAPSYEEYPPEMDENSKVLIHLPVMKKK